MRMGSRLPRQSSLAEQFSFIDFSRFSVSQKDEHSAGWALFPTFTTKTCFSETQGKQRLGAQSCTRGKSPGKANVLIMQAESAGRILGHRRMCHPTRRLSRTSKTNPEPNTWRNCQKLVNSQPILHSTYRRSQQPTTNLLCMLRG